MLWYAISGSWRVTNAEVEADVRREVSVVFNAGHGIVTGGALGVDYIATDQALQCDPTCQRLLIIIPTPLLVYAAHYRQRAQEGVITATQAESLIKQLETVQQANPAALEQMTHNACNEQTYYDRNTRVIEAATALLAFQVNASQGTQDAIDKAKARSLPIIHQRYTIAP
jgi:predicted Rossmann fold nucleotide-binding protein DprA/Smf involved in DNA uptake